MQYAVTQINRVIQAEQQDFRPVFLRTILKNAFASEAGLRIFAHRLRRHLLRTSAGGDPDQRINASGGKRDDPAASEMSADIGGSQNIHRPRLRLASLRPEFAPRHEHDVLHLRQRFHGVLIQKIAGYRFDSPVFKLLPLFFSGKTGYADHFF